MAQGNSAQFAIDIAAKMTGAEYTVAQLDALTADLQGAGKGAEHFQLAVQQVADKLTVASAASQEAAAKLAAGNEEFAVLERAAIQAAKAEEKLQASIDRTSAALTKAPLGSAKFAALNASLTALKASQEGVASNAVATRAALDAYKVTLGGLESKATGAAKAEKDLAQQLGNVRKLGAHVDKTLAGNAERTAKVQGAMSALGGPLGSLGSRVSAPIKGFSDLSAVLGKGKAVAAVAAVGFAALAAAAVLLAAAAVAGVVAIGAWAVKLADTARAAGLAQQAFDAVNPSLAGMSDELARIESVTNVSKESLRGLAKTLRDAKVSAADLPAALEAAALAEAALGQGGSADFIANIRAGKKSVRELAGETRKQLGGIVAQQLRGLDGQAGTFKRNIAGLFGGLNIDPVLDGLARLVALFDESTVAGQSIKFLFETVFQPLIDQAKNASLVIEAFALGFLIGLTKVYIALKPAIKAFKEFFGINSPELSSTLNFTAEAAEWLAKAFVYGALAVGGLVTIALAVAASLAAIPLAIVAAGAAVIAFGPEILAALGGAVDSIKALFSVDTWVTIGTNLMLGLVRGITGAVGAVINAVSGAVTGAIDTAKSLLGVHSPSKVFAGIGENTGEGFALGVTDASGDAQSAMAALVEPPDLPASPLAQQGGLMPAPQAQALTQAAPQAASAGAGSSVDFKGAIFNFYGVEGADDAEARFGTLLTRVLEGDAIQLGGEVAPA